MSKNKKFPRKRWERHARLRRFVLLVLIIFTTIVAAYQISGILPHQGSTNLELAIVIVFATLFAWISIGFWEAIAGLFTLLCRFNRLAVLQSPDDKDTLDGTEGRTAILMPICNEDVDRVFAGLHATYHSLEDTGQLQYFDFFVLSDSSDPDKWIEEEIAWAESCRTLGAYNRVFYRHRKVNLKRKSGNIADFCRRWGQNYHYMIVMDADSVLTGSIILRMVRLMANHPNMGILQTAPHPVNRETLIARIQQFASRVYGPMFNAGLHFMQLGDSHFWGHNAIIRVAPFMEHCGLPELSGKPPRGGFILSHDFVEAAFMRRGGWEVWFAFDLEGGYEEIPPTLLDELKREQRWCQGNIQHMRLLFTRGLFWAHRALFLHGALSYIASPLWVLFLGLSTTEAISEVFRVPVYFPTDHALFPEWPTWYTQWAFTLLSATAIILFLPKLLSVLLILAKKGLRRAFGGAIRILLSTSLEILFAVFFAPIRMLFHTKFVIFALLGFTVEWTPQRRSDRATGWLDALRFHGFGTALGLIWGGALFIYNQSFFWCNMPILVPLVLSVPLSVFSSRVGVGRAFRKMGLFLIPEEIDPPPILRSLDNLQQKERSASCPDVFKGKGFMMAVVDPYVNALHCTLLRRDRKVSQTIDHRRQRLQEKALIQGPACLSVNEKKELLSDPSRMRKLHLSIWESSDRKLAEIWGIS